MARRTKKANGKVSSHRTWFTLPVDISFSRGQEARHRLGDAVKPRTAAQQRNKVQLVLLQAVNVDQRLVQKASETVAKGSRSCLELSNAWLTCFGNHWDGFHG